MNILVCFKVCPEMEHLSASQKCSIHQGEDPFRFAKQAFGACDESAMEAALRLRDQRPDTWLTAITAGACPSRFLQELLALGFDDVVHLPCVAPLDFATQSVCEGLCAFIRAHGPFDLILAGQQASPQEAATVPGRLAAMLQIPMISHCYRVEALEDRFEICAHQDGFERTFSVSSPCVCALENAQHPYLRLSKLKDRLAAAQKKARTIPFEELASVPTRCGAPITFLEEPQRPKCRLIEGSLNSQCDMLVEILEKTKR